MNTTKYIPNTAVAVANHGKGIIHAAKAGWFRVELEDGSVINARARDLTVIGEFKAGYVKAGIMVYDPQRYVRHEVRTESGRKAYDTNDKVAKALRGATIEEAYSIAAKALHCTVKELVQKYGNLNKGQQRMTLGNRMRAALKQG